MTETQLNSLLREYCIEEQDLLYSHGTRKRRSVLLQMQEDIDFNLGLYGKFRTLNLTDTQQSLLDTQLAPLFVVPLLFCSSVDLFARTYHKGRGGFSNGDLFKESAELFFSFSAEQSTELWRFRNSLSHQYSINRYTLSRLGHSESVLRINDDLIVLSVRPMRTLLEQAKQRLFDILNSENLENKKRTCRFIDKHGFTYYLAN